ncbi:glycosyltransferase family 4 protein [Marixanthomonas ophiurae]|uniref:Glycosyltransferase n=1 Tax=Marixanthomonas ophiurae TaxID=387659 RepID=A0A3E1QD24_9FLAO|nr:glycosyltransferase family 4 protein [Marixanthomonas ophiurae]RFN60048.1 glycosyltransferase [Marixanthomonas ophiurae]
MKKRRTIAIYSGAIPSTTFVEQLIKGVAAHQRVLLFGRITKPISYTSKNITVHATPNSHFLNFIYSLYRLSFLLLKKPKGLFVLLRQTKKRKGLYKRWMWFTKALPIVLYRPDVFHIQWAKSLDSFFFLKTEFNIPIVLSLRGAHINYSPIASQKLTDSYKEQFPNVAGFHAVSKAISSEAQKYNAPTNRIQVIHSMVPEQFFKAFTSYKKRKSGPFNLVSIGRPHWIKGYSYAIQAIRLLLEQGFDCTYTIIGIDEVDEGLLYQINDLGLEKNVRLLPSLPQSKLIMELPNYDALLLPSLKEGIANVVLEAMAMGVPVISSDCGGMKEVVTDTTGFLVPIRNPKAIAKAVIQLDTMKETEVQALTQQAHNFIKREFLSTKGVDEFLALYESSMKSN